MNDGDACEVLRELADQLQAERRKVQALMQAAQNALIRLEEGECNKHGLRLIPVCEGLREALLALTE